MTLKFRGHRLDRVVVHGNCWMKCMFFRDVPDVGFCCLQTLNDSASVVVVGNYLMKCVFQDRFLMLPL